MVKKDVYFTLLREVAPFMVELNGIIDQMKENSDCGYSVAKVRFKLFPFEPDLIEKWLL